MNLSRLKQASQHNVESWLIKELDLTNCQKNRLLEQELIRWSPFKFMEEKKKEEVDFLWRFSMLVLPFYIILVWLYNPLQFIFTGKWGINQTFLTKFHYPWMYKLKLNL